MLLPGWSKSLHSYTGPLQLRLATPWSKPFKRVCDLNSHNTCLFQNIFSHLVTTEQSPEGAVSSHFTCKPWAAETVVPAHPVYTGGSVPAGLWHTCSPLSGSAHPGTQACRNTSSHHHGYDRWPGCSRGWGTLVRYRYLWPRLQARRTWGQEI